MRFRKFLERVERSGGGFGPEDTKPTGSGRQQEMGGTVRTMGQESIEGHVRLKDVTDKGVRMTIEDENGNTLDMAISEDFWRANGSPEVGNIVQVVYDRDGTIRSLRINHNIGTTPIADPTGYSAGSDMQGGSGVPSTGLSFGP